MSTIVGGLRARLLLDSFRNYVVDGLDDIGWFASGRQHKTLNVIDAPVDWSQTITPNAIAFQSEDNRELEAELGNHHRTMSITALYVDIWAESDPIGKHIAYDVRDLLLGKFRSLGYSTQGFTLLDYRQATPTDEGFISVESVTVDPARNFPHPWNRHWFVVRAEIEDEYETDQES